MPDEAGASHTAVRARVPTGDRLLAAVRRRLGDQDEFDLTTPGWRAFTRPRGQALPDFTAVREPRLPEGTADWLERVVLVHRLREVSALTGFTRTEAPEWLPDAGDTDPCGSAAQQDRPHGCRAELRGEGVFLALDESRLTEWERREAVLVRERLPRAAHADRCAARYPLRAAALPHTPAHVLVRRFALEYGYGASRMAERVSAGSGPDPMSGILLWTAAPDSEGTLGGRVFPRPQRPARPPRSPRPRKRPGAWAAPTRCAPNTIRASTPSWSPPIATPP
ncbi:DUF1998 domain-containing protein [Streptomyces kebangsaanensis]|uniref:DUF1998 domain-containing protein n=1 Tax=Streptomyces kebangsaanensis TaxID=864058 RepID=UPI00093AB02F|nr:DUF1998 domain-containing protein [Streptomyces kebangsaanensis]